MVSNLAQQVGRLAFTLVLARMIGPADFGIVAQAVIYIGLVQLFLDQGFSAALIQKREVDRLDLGSVFWLNVLSALLLASMTVVVAPLVAQFFRTPEITSVLRVLAISLLLSSFATVPLAILNRHLQFRRLATINVFAVLGGGTAGTIHAVAGGSYWALVTQTLVGVTITLIGALRVSGPPPLRGSWNRLRSMLSFSSGLFGARVAQYAGSQGDSVLVGRFLGATDLAFYTLAFRMLQLPTRTFARLVNQVAFPVYSRMQHQPERVRAWFLLSTRATLLVAYPLLTLAILLEPLLVPLMLGEAWTPAVLPMQIFTLGAFRGVALQLCSPLLISFGHTRTILRLAVLEVVLTLAACAIGLRWGTVGVAAGYVAARLVLGPFVIKPALAVISLRQREHIRAVAPLWFACACLAGVYLGVRAGAEALGAVTAAAVPLAVLVGAVAYLVLIRLAFGSIWQDGTKVAAMVLGRRPTERLTGTSPQP